MSAASCLGKDLSIPGLQQMIIISCNPALSCGKALICYKNNSKACSATETLTLLAAIAETELLLNKQSSPGCSWVVPAAAQLPGGASPRLFGPGTTLSGSGSVTGDGLGALGVKAALC